MDCALDKTSANLVFKISPTFSTASLTFSSSSYKAKVLVDTWIQVHKNKTCVYICIYRFIDMYLYTCDIHTHTHTHICAYSLQLCLTLCDPTDRSPPSSSVHGILYASILEWVAMPSSRGSSSPRDWTQVSCSSCISGRFFTTVPPGKPIYTYTYT